MCDSSFPQVPGADPSGTRWLRRLVAAIGRHGLSSHCLVCAEAGQPGRGLGFPGLAEGQDAQLWDFIYYSFTIGLASQTADVSALSTRLRRITLVHSVFAFYYNTVVLALAVNAAASLG